MHECLMREDVTPIPCKKGFYIWPDNLFYIIIIIMYYMLLYLDCYQCYAPETFLVKGLMFILFYFYYNAHNVLILWAYSRQQMIRPISRLFAFPLLVSLTKYSMPLSFHEKLMTMKKILSFLKVGISLCISKNFLGKSFSQPKFFSVTFCK